MSFEDEFDRVNRLWDASIENKNKRIKELETENKQLKDDLKTTVEMGGVLEKIVWKEKCLRADAEDKVKQLVKENTYIAQRLNILQDLLDVVKEEDSLNKLNIAESMLEKAQSRLIVAETILGELFPDVDDSEIFKKYCKLCSEDENCEWGDNFPHCFVEKALGGTSPSCVKGEDKE